MALIVAAGLNALLLHRGALRAVAFDVDVPPPRLRIAAVASLVLWTGVIACGRFLAYL